MYTQERTIKAFLVEQLGLEDAEQFTNSVAFSNVIFTRRGKVVSLPVTAKLLYKNWRSHERYLSSNRWLCDYDPYEE